jgi:hypothetical protein
VKVSVVVVGAAGAGNVTVPLKPCELGSCCVLDPPAGVKLTVAVCVVALQNGEFPVSIGGGVEPPP